MNKDKLFVGSLSGLIFILSIITIPLSYFDIYGNMSELTHFQSYLYGFGMGISFLIGGFLFYGCFFIKGVNDK